VEKVWFRSIATQLESKVPLKGKIIKGDLGDQKDNKNAYVLMKTKEEASDARSNLNQTLLDDKHIRVDIDLKDSRLQNDYDSTIFIGNLPFMTNEEELRAHFAECGKIMNVRVIRDPQTFIGKGIAYIQFGDKTAMKKSLELKNGQKFNKRELRIKKAVEPKRLEKKKNRKEEKRVAREQQKADDEAADDEINKLRNFQNAAYNSDEDSDEREA